MSEIGVVDAFPGLGYALRIVNFCIIKKYTLGDKYHNMRVM